MIYIFLNKKHILITITIPITIRCADGCCLRAFYVLKQTPMSSLQTIQQYISYLSRTQKEKGMEKTNKVNI